MGVNVSSWRALALAVVVLSPSKSIAAPLIMGPLYSEPKVSTPAPNGTEGESRKMRQATLPAPPTCVLNVVELSDVRRDPQMVGLWRSAIKAPVDRAAWLRSVIQTGFRARGFQTSFGPSEAAPDAVQVKIALRSIWLKPIATNKTGSVIMRMSAGRGSLGPERFYRADVTNVNWWGSQSEFNDLSNLIFARVLDSMTVDLRPLCPGSPVADTAAPAPVQSTHVSDAR